MKRLVKNNINLLGLIAVISVILNLILSAKFLNIPKLFNNNQQTVKVTQVIDGDTFDTSTGERIRLYEINAPELPKGCLGQEAKVRLENLILNKNVKIEKINKDNFGRTIALVYFDKLMINEVLVEEGLAYFKKSKNLTDDSLIIEKAENKARATNRAVWSSLCQTQKDGCIIKGNYRSSDNTRIYHTRDCYNYDKITIKPGTTDRWFCTEDEARTSGFRKSQDCPK